MKFINEDNTIWSHDNGKRSGIIADPFYIDWLADGGTVDAYVAPPVPLPELLPYQFHAMLALSGKKAALDTYIAGLTEPTKTVAAYKLSTSLAFHRDNDLVELARVAVNLTKEQLDALWLQASQIA